MLQQQLQGRFGQPDVTGESSCYAAKDLLQYDVLKVHRLNVVGQKSVEFLNGRVYVLFSFLLFGSFRGGRRGIRVSTLVR